MNQCRQQALVNQSTCEPCIPIYLQQFPSYSNRKCKKSPFSRTAAHIFVSPWRRPCDYHAVCSMDGKHFNACQTPRSMYLSIFNNFRVIRCLSEVKSMRKSKSRYFFNHIFVFPGDAPGVITLNVVWMAREFDACKLPRCMCPSNYNRF